METQIATTPFGRRPASLAQIATQAKLREAMEAARAPGSNAPAAVNKWHLFRTLTEIRERLGVSDRALSVLNALLTFHPETALALSDGEDASDDLVVYPSNRQLSLRAHGMAEVTLRRHLAALVEAGLIVRRDSPNGKRYARRGPAGEPAAVFGFDLTPLVVQAVAFEAEAETLRRQRRERQFVKERISLRRRDIQKWLTLALDEDLPGDWEPLRRQFMALARPLRSLRTDDDLAAMDAQVGDLHAVVAKLLNLQVVAKKSDGNDVQTERHKASSKTQNTKDIEPTSDGGGADVCDGAGNVVDATGSEAPLGLVLEACIDLHDWCDTGRIESWSELLTTAERVRPMLGISPDAWAEARRVLKPREAAIALGFILQRSEHSSEVAVTSDGQALVNGSPAIRSAGAYLRSLTAQAEAGALRLTPLLMALIGQRLKQRKRGG
jgi:replication initiation protein RepC